MHLMQDKIISMGQKIADAWDILKNYDEKLENFMAFFVKNPHWGQCF